MRGPLALSALIAGAFLLPPLVAFDPYYLYVGSVAWRWAALASAWGLLAFAGQISFGHAAYFGAGAYTSTLLAERLGVSPWFGLAAAAVGGAAVALPLGLAAHRLRGAYLALGTLAYAEGLRVVALNWTGLTGGGSGLVGIPELPALALGPVRLVAGGRAGRYYVALLLFLAVLGSAALLRGTRVGLAWAAIREREERAEILGIATTRYKLLAFACSGSLTAVGGALYGHTVRFIEPDLVFGRGISILALVMATFGGAQALLGPTLGAVVLYLSSELVFQPLLPALHQLPYALGLLAGVLFLPRGLAGLFRFPERR